MDYLEADKTEYMWLVGCLGFMAYQPLWVIQHQILSIYTYIFNQRFQNEY